MSKETREDYFNTITGIVEDIFSEFEVKTLEDFEDKRDDISDSVYEYIDGSSWVIYNYAAQKVLEFSDNADA